MSYTDKFEAFSIIKNGSTYKVIPFSEQKNKQLETIEDENSTITKQAKKKTKKKIIKKKYNTKLDIKHKKHSKKEGKKYNNFIFLKKLKHFFNKNINTPFVVTNLKRFVFMIGKYILHNPFEVYNFLFSNKKQILKTNLISLSKILKLMNTKQIKFVSKFAKQKLNNM
jgi:hypothetical protein